MLLEVIKQFKQIRNARNTEAVTEEQPRADDTERQKVVKLPWIPVLSLKLKRAFRKAGLKAVFKSSNNLNTILTSTNKSNLPANSLPGVYQVECGCGTRYVGETKLKVATRIQQHKKNAILGNRGHSGISDHAIDCSEDVRWDEAKTIHVESRYFHRKVREALEIQRGNLVRSGSNQDYGRYLEHHFWLPIMAMTSNISTDRQSTQM